MFLENIIINQTTKLAGISREYKESIAQKVLSCDLQVKNSLTETISREKQLSIIAEVKKASPSKGLLCPDFDPVKLGKIYHEHGASAISVLTEEKYFLGSLDNLEKIRGVTNLPLLRKDFILEEFQLYEAKLWGADAALLIAAILDDAKLNILIKLCDRIGLDALVEVHSKEELQRAVLCGSSLIGINNRNLKTFSVDLMTTIGLMKYIPQNVTVISESGIRTRKDMELLASQGVDGVLIGEALVKERDIRKKLEGLSGVLANG